MHVCCSGATDPSSIRIWLRERISEALCEASVYVFACNVFGNSLHAFTKEKMS